MNLFQRLRFNLWYFRRPLWDSGITPPELWQFIEKNPSGRAIDLGCGTGTNAISLARHGWHVTGVDFANRAIEQARRKAREQNLSINFIVDDVTRLSDVIGPFDLILDIGCFHGILPNLRPVYLKSISRILVPGGTWLLYAMRQPPAANFSAPGVTEDEIVRLSTVFNLLHREDGFDPGGRESSWFWFGSKQRQ
jgi:2-polyprenyl-3-methyl-5-hydroxy-6-metoxy-1,4-benzoquinol methylase